MYVFLLSLIFPLHLSLSASSSPSTANIFTTTITPAIGTTLSERSNASVVTYSNQDDLLALLSFKSLILHDPSNALASWTSTNNSLHYCRWQGVTCAERMGRQRVIALELEALDLVSSISPAIANLTFLERLHLPENQLHGSIPQEIGFLSHLQHLNLSVNSLRGVIPETLFTHCYHLQSISLWNNSLHGSIPPNISHCSSLRVIHFGWNELSGTIPASLGALQGLNVLWLLYNQLEDRGWAFLDALTKCSNLQELVLTSNRLEGVLPSSVANLSSRLELLTMDANQIKGSIPLEIGNLANLKMLYLSHNLLTGSIPDSLGKFQRLSTLSLASNQLSGSIPPFLGNLSSLTVLWLDDNTFTGRIPANLGNLSALTRLQLSSNNLKGGIPPSLGNLLNLTTMFLSDNKLTGGIPPSLGNLALLTKLDLAFNSLTGFIPSSIWNLSSLLQLDMGNNNLYGAFPPDMGQALPHLRSLRMYQNQFHGPIPFSLSNASMLEYIELNENKLSGTIPPSIGTLKHLRALLLGTNQLEARNAMDWNFLTSLTNSTRLRVLELYFNKLGGILPTSIANLSTRLEWLNMYGNRISGHIAPEMGNLINLTYLNLGENFFTGTVPTTLGRMSNLNYLDLSINQLSGVIPTIFGNLTQLTQLYLDSNNMSGSIPTTLANCKNLLVLNLTYNKLTGTIPKEILTISSLSIGLHLSHNSLIGSLPSELGTLINIETLAVSKNNLSGEIPSSLGECLHLEYLYIEENLFHGTIPSSLSNLKGLQGLDLSQNNLSGKIPEFLGTFRSLQYLNLSFNNFEGEVPKEGVFKNLTALSVTGNNKLCGGIPELNLPPCSNGRTRNKHQFVSRLIAIISAVSAALCLILLLCFFHSCHWKKKKTIESSVTTHLKDQYMKVSYAELHRATNGFSSANLVGVGGFGSVYRGAIAYNEQNADVAVKVLNLQQRGATRSFIAEYETLTTIRHRNLVKLLTACSSIDFQGNEFKALVFEFLSNGSLEKWLHPVISDQISPQKLSLIQRLNIAFDVACALDYLHQHGPTPIVHSDLKPSNVLLDNDMAAHVGDFGLARFLITTVNGSSQNLSSSLLLKGSIGYVAPEYGLANKVSTYGDVYSYGILLLEMFTGRSPTDDAFKEGFNLHKFVETAFPDRVADILDRYLFIEENSNPSQGMRLIRDADLECIVSVFKIGILCSSELPNERMTMGDVVRELHTVRDAFFRSGVQGGGEIEPHREKVHLHAS